MLSLIEAARVSGQSTIWRAVNSGRLSATRTYTGDYQIDPAELHCVFSLETGEGRATAVSVKRDGMAMERAETDLMQAPDRPAVPSWRTDPQRTRQGRDAWRSQADRLRRLVG
jgi:hypothetical protein